VKLFGEYLVEQNLINEDQLLRGLVEQAVAQPPVLKVVYDLEILSRGEILQVLRIQSTNQCSFIEAAQKLSLWSEAKSARLMSELAGRRPPLGEILIRSGSVDLSALTRALDDFYSERLSEPVPQAAVPPRGPSVYPEVFEFLNGNFERCIAEAITSVSGGRLAEAGVLQRLADETRRLVGAAKLYDFQDMVTFLAPVEQGLRECLRRSPQKLGAEVLDKVHKALTEFREIVAMAVLAHAAGTLAPRFFLTGEAEPKVKSIQDWFTLIAFDLESIEKESTL
jgi:hypothetical protein